MALIKCAECGRDISDQAVTCPGCGAPVVVGAATARAPSDLAYEDSQFIATREMMATLAKSAVQACKYRIDSADDAAGTVTFTTGMTMGSWTGVSGTLVYREVAPYHFEVTGAAKQNVRGGQVVALDLFGEAKSKVDNVVQEMIRQARHGEVSSFNPEVAGTSGTGCAILLIALGLGPSLLIAGQFI
jgi:hypothetical protein